MTPFAVVILIKHFVSSTQFLASLLLKQANSFLHFVLFFMVADDVLS